MKHRLSVVLILTALVLVIAGSAAFAQDLWPTFHQNSHRTGVVTNGSGQGVLGHYRPKPIWVFPAPEQSDLVVDNAGLDAANWYFSTSGGAWTQAPLNGEAPYGEDSPLYVYTNSTKAETMTAQWDFMFAPQADRDFTLKGGAASFWVYIWVPLPGPGETQPHIRDARYTVLIDDVAVGTYQLDQRYGGDWRLLTQQSFAVKNGDTLSVRLSNMSEAEDENGDLLQQTVCADAVMLRLDAGMVLSSPVASVHHKVVITTKTENTQAWSTPDFYGTAVTGAAYGLGTETNSGAGTGDDRGRMVWRYPDADHNFIVGGIGGSAAIWDRGGTEVAVIPGADGQVYVVDPGQTAGQVAPLVWRGPGYYMDDAGSEGTMSTSGSFSPQPLYGRQGDTASLAPAVARDPNVNPAKTTWTVGIPPSIVDRTYDAYAWIPPAQTNEQYIMDAQYYQIGLDGKPVMGSTTTVPQSMGGFWTEIAHGIRVPAGTSTTTLAFGLDNTTAGPTTNTYVVADAVRLVPAELGTWGTFDMSSPAVADDGGIYIGSTQWGEHPTGRLFKLGLGSKDPIWTFPAANEAPVGGIEAAPSLSETESTVYIGSSDGRLYAVNAQTGVLKWQFPDPKNAAFPSVGQISSTAAVLGASGRTIVFINTGGWYGNPDAKGIEGKVYAVEDMGDHMQLLWSHPDGTDALGIFLYSTALLMPRTWGDPDPDVVMGSMDGNLYSMSAMGDGDGTTTRRMTANLANFISTSPAGTYITYAKLHDTTNTARVDLPMAFVGAGSRIFGVDLTDGSKDWWWDLMGFTYSSPSITNYRIYTGDTEGYTWAFSTGTPGSNGNSSEDWNSTLGQIPKPGSEPTAANGRDAHPEVDVFTKSVWLSTLQPIMEAAEQNGVISLNSNDLHKYAIDGSMSGSGSSGRSATNYTLEWGEDLYVVAWNLLDPNKQDPDMSKWVKDDFTASPTKRCSHTYPGKVIITIKNNDPGKAGQAMSTITLSGQQVDYFNDAKEYTDSSGNKVSGYATFYAAKLISIGASGDNAFSSPGANFTITAREEPASPNASSLDTPVPKDTEVDITAAGYQPELQPAETFTINNPIGIGYDSTYGNAAMTSWIGVDTGGATTQRIDGNAHGNGNVNGDLPVIWGGFTPHNKLSETRTLNVYDRSLLALTTRRITNFRIQRQDLQWTGPKTQRMCVLPWDDAVPVYIPTNWANGDPPNASPIYPDIDLRQIRCRSVINGRDPSQGTITLIPSKAASSGLSSWGVNSTGVNFAVQIPRFQPANIPSISNLSLANKMALDPCGYTSLVYAYVDSNGNGVCDGVGLLGMSSIASTKLSGSTSAEPHRVIEIKAHVPADYRAEIEDTRVDVGEVPQGFGFTASASGTAPQVFQPALDRMPLQVAPPGFAEWFKPLTVRNTGNVNLPNVAFIRTNMVSDTVQQPMRDGSGNYIAGSGYWIPGGWTLNSSGLWDPGSACVETTLDLLSGFMDPTTGVSPMPVLGLYHPYRSLHKADVGDSEGAQLTVPDCPKWFGTPVVQDRPRVSVSMPIGTPVGSYYGKLSLGVSFDINPPFKYRQVSNTADVVATCTESRITDGSTIPGAPHLAQVDMAPPVASSSVTPQPTLDAMPAAFRSPNGDITLFWSSSRYPTVTRGTGSNDAAEGDPWYLYQSKLAVNPATGMWNLQPGPSATMQWWVPTDTSTTVIPEPTAANLRLFFPTPPGSDTSLGAPGTVIPSSVRFGSPSVALDKINGKAYLLFTGQAYKDAGPMGTDQTGQVRSRRTLESRAYYSEIRNGAVDPTMVRSTSPNPTSTGLTISGDWTTPKFGIRGAVVQRTDASVPELWSFWYGGGNGKWRIYYNVKTDPANLNAQWSNEALLPIPKNLSSVAEPSPVVHVWNGATGADFQVVYSGISNYHKNSDIYMSRYTSYDPATDPSCDPTNTAADADHVKIAKAGGWPVDLVELPQRSKEIAEILEKTGKRIVGEKLTRDATQKTWYSRDVDWVADVVSEKNITPGNPTSFRVYVLFNPDPTTPVSLTNLGSLAADRIYQLNIGSTVKDSATGAIAYSFDGGNPLENRLRTYFRSVVINPVEGTVKFMKLPTTTIGTSLPIRSMLVVAGYFPRAYRLTTDGVADASPCAVMDDDPNPRFGAPVGSAIGLPFYVPSSVGGSNIVQPPTDRLWVFWRRPGMDRPGTGIYYKAQRYTVQLDYQIGLNKDTPSSGGPDQYTPAVSNIVVPQGGVLKHPVEVDWVKNRLYFASEDAKDMLMLPAGSLVEHPYAKMVQVTYRDANGNTHENEEHYIQFADEDLGQPGKTFGNLTSLMVNEGQVNAFKDPMDNKLWVFWSSTRAGNSDLYYETISPSFGGKEFR